MEERITKLEKEVQTLRREVGYLRTEIDKEIKHPLASIIITVLLIGVGVLAIYLKEHPEILAF